MSGIKKLLGDIYRCYLRLSAGVCMIWRYGSIILPLYILQTSPRIIKCVKKMFGYTRRDSMTGVFFDLLLPTLDTVVHNSRVLFANQCLRSCNKIVQWFLTTCVLIFLSLLLYIFYV